MIKFKYSSNIKILDIPNKDLILGDKLVFSLRTGKLIRLSGYYVGLLLKNEFINMPAALIKILVRNELIVPDYEDESAEMKYRTDLYNKDDKKYDPSVYQELTDHQILASAQHLKLI
jgi:hypothetical protein